MEWIEVKKIKPQFDVKVLTWNEDEPNEPARTDTLIGIKTTSKGESLEWLENGMPSHWMPLPKTPEQK